MCSTCGVGDSMCVSVYGQSMVLMLLCVNCLPFFRQFTSDQWLYILFLLSSTTYCVLLCFALLICRLSSLCGCLHLLIELLWWHDEFLHFMWTLPAWWLRPCKGKLWPPMCRAAFLFGNRCHWVILRCFSQITWISLPLRFAALSFKKCKFGNHQHP